MNHLDLVVPGLCGPLPDLNGIQPGPALSSLIKLLARADRLKSNVRGFHSELSDLFGLDATQALPSAALTLYGHRQERVEGVWFHADPVHLQADMDHAVLRDSSSLDIEQSESEALLNAANQHFSEDGLELIAVDESHWFIKTSASNDITTSALHDVIGCNVNFHMPQGNDEVFWKRFLNETQMLFHSSDVNQRREESGQLAINSIWLSGGGELPDDAAKINRAVISNNTLVKGLAQLCQTNCSLLSDITSLQKTVDEEVPPIIVIDDVFTPACYGDTQLWQQTSEKIFEQWIEPLVKYALSRRLSVRLHTCNGMKYIISPNNKFRFFRRSSLDEHIPVHG